MFATHPIPKGEVVIVWGGTYVPKAEAERLAQKGTLVMQWDEDVFSVEEAGEDPAYHINHSCNPNVWMDNAFTLSARRDIPIGTELTTDYALWEARENYVAHWDCQCGTRNCRKKITGSDWQLPTLQQAYAGHFSPLIQKRILTLHHQHYEPQT